MKINHTKSQIEIRSLLLSAIFEAKIFLIWQRTEDNNIQFQIEGKLDSIDEQGQMTFNLNESVEFDLEKDVFFAMTDSTLVFKIKVLKYNEKQIFTNLPEEAKYKERRKDKRKKYKIKDYKQVELLFIFKEGVKGDNVLSSVIDISKSGICLLVTKETLNQIETEKELVITSISSDLGFKLEKGKIMNARKYIGVTMAKGEFYALGIMFT